MNPTERERQVFTNLAQGGEGEILQGYIKRLRDQVTNEVIDNKEATEADLKAARLTRDALDRFAERFVIINDTKFSQVRFD